MKEIRKMDEPLNSNERFLYGVNVRLEILIDMLSSFLDVYAKQNNIATTQNVVETKDVANQEEEKIKELIVDTENIIKEIEVKPKRKRTTKK